MILRLTTLPDDIKGPDDDIYHGRVPKRARYMSPDAAISFHRMVKDYPELVFTDIWRSAESSLMAMRRKRGVMPPGFSGHGFGFCFDADVLSCQKALDKNYVELVELFNVYGFYCHRQDLDPVASESWHFNYLGQEPQKYLGLTRRTEPRSWSLAIEGRMMETYGSDFDLSNEDIQESLRKLSVYRGEIDGKLGALSQESIRSFQRAWGLFEDGLAGKKTQRTLAFVAAERSIESMITV